MDVKSLINKLDRIVEESKTGILCTVDKSGTAQMRWMTPTLHKKPTHSLFCFSIPDTPKIKQIRHNPQVSWSIQTRDLREVITLTGKAIIIEDAVLKADLLDILGHRLHTFFNVNKNSEEWVVIETIIEKATYFNVTKHEKHTVEFK